MELLYIHNNVRQIILFEFLNNTIHTSPIHKTVTLGHIMTDGVYYTVISQL